MRKLFVFTLMAVFISLLAVSAYAQSGTQTQHQTKPEVPEMNRADEGPKGDGAGEPDRTRTSTTTGLNEKADLDKAGDQSGETVQTKPEDPVRDYTDADPKGDGAAKPDRSRNAYETPQESQADKVGDQAQDLNYGEGDGNNHELGDNNRHGEDYTGETGPHGDIVASGDKDGDQTQGMNYGEGDGNNHELGDNNRHGEDYTGETGPHGPGSLVTGFDENYLILMGLDKMFGEGANGNFAGSMVQHSWGPGVAQDGGHVGGPDISGHFGPGGSSSDGSAGTGSGAGGSGAADTKGQSRAGRR